MACQIKLNAPFCSTFLEVFKVRWVGGSAVASTLTGIPTLAAIWLIPLGVACYVLVGGMRATLFADYTHTKSGWAFVRSRAFLLGGSAWFVIPFLFSMTMGLSARGLLFSGDPPMPALSADDITAGLSAPAAGVALAGTGGAVAVLIILFLAVTSASSAQQVAVASVLTFDVYKPYIRPNASKREIFIMSHAGVLIWAVVMSLFGTIFHYAGMSLGWLYLAQGIIIAPAVVPIFCGLVWKRTNKLACIVAMMVGIVCGVVTWLVTASCLYNQVSVATTGKDYPTLAGNVVSLGVSAIITVVGSLIRPETEDHFVLTRSINAPEDVVERMAANSGLASPSTPDAEKSPLESEKVAYTLETIDYVKAAGLDADELRKTLRFTTWVSVAACFTLCVLIPACLASRKVWNSTGLAAYIWLGFIWLLWTTLAVGVQPI
ncbi:probable DUR3 - Urea permease [Ustilago bromivora]|uniref:Probable DUR3 - Urea permease n=1 Tax=Ustilago bromivora TaxID=307758 RepID=A0A8H8QGD1_9BASI|nr:probable DUR3 - Urea permease [Ustilago bromivora]